jgi:hypothetical protein
MYTTQQDVTYKDSIAYTFTSILLLIVVTVFR